MSGYYQNNSEKIIEKNELVSVFDLVCQRRNFFGGSGISASGEKLIELLQQDKYKDLFSNKNDHINNKDKLKEFINPENKKSYKSDKKMEAYNPFLENGNVNSTKVSNVLENLSRLK